MVPQKIHYIYIHTSTAVRRNAAFSSHLCVICKETLSSDFGATFLRERLTGPSLKASFFLRPTFQLVCWKIFSLQKNLIANPTFLHFFPQDIWLLYAFMVLNENQIPSVVTTRPAPTMVEGPRKHHQSWDQKPGQWWQSSKGLDLGGVLGANFYLGEATKIFRWEGAN